MILACCAFSFLPGASRKQTPFNINLKFLERRVMSNKVIQTGYYLTSALLAAIFSLALVGGCAVKAANDKKPSDNSAVVAESKTADSKVKIRIQPNSPADTVRVFYKNLREKRFREAMFLTNLRPAIEGLTDAEMKDLQVDFEPLANKVPAEIEIKGEIISGNNRATVTAKLPNNETEQIELQEINLRRENEVWIILTVDEAAEAAIKKEGKNYFFALKIETHQEEAKKTLEQIAKAQFVYAAQNDGLYADMPTLAQKKLLPEGLENDLSGYSFKILLSPDKKKYTATAEPVVYGKTGKLSYRFDVEGKKSPVLKGVDNKGKQPKN